MTAQLVVGPLQGYRCWRVERDGGQTVLRSLYYPTPWPAHGPLQASCESKPGLLGAWIRHVLSRDGVHHPAPSWACQCGIYGLARFEHAETVERAPRSQRGRAVESWQVVGAVLLWGRVMQHEHGYRAEYARPLKLLALPALLRTPESRASIEAVAQRYALEIVSDVEALTRPA